MWWVAALAAALVLNRPDWLAERNYTMAEAIARIGPDWTNLVPVVASEFERDAQADAHEAAERDRQRKIDEIGKCSGADSEPDFIAHLVTYGDSPGYRDVSFTVDLEPIGNASKRTRVNLRFNPVDGRAVAEHIAGVHRFAWNRSGGRPLDAKPDEMPPRGWLGDA